MSTMSPTTIASLRAGLDREAVGAAMMDLAGRLYPICRSITGDGVRRTLSILRESIPIKVHEVPTGTRVFDWTVPKEWNIRGAYLEGPDGERVVDFADHTLHVLNYSVPVDRTLPLGELREHLFTLPEQPERIPYRTSYYNENWGFCLPHTVYESLPDGEYRAVIDAELEDGSLTYGELALPGRSEREVLVTCHVCHPSLANDNLSGIAVVSQLAAHLATLPREARAYSYRFLFIPGTIGSITWLSQNPAAPERIAHGLVAANLGDGGCFHYKRSFRGDAPIDRAVEHVLATSGEEHGVEDFVPFGYDERQFNAPGFRLPVGSLTRTPYGRYPEYHTSADDLELIRPEALAGSLARYLEVVEVLEGDAAYRNLAPYGEPQLGKRGLYAAIGGGEAGRRRQLALLWVLSLSDGEHTLLDVAERSGRPFAEIREAADRLLEAELLEPVSSGEGAS